MGAQSWGLGPSGQRDGRLAAEASRPRGSMHRTPGGREGQCGCRWGVRKAAEEGGREGEDKRRQDPGCTHSEGHPNEFSF